MSDGPSMSVAMSVTVTGPVYQPFAPCDPDRNAAVTGASLSIFGVTGTLRAPAWTSDCLRLMGRSATRTSCRTLKTPPLPGVLDGTSLERTSTPPTEPLNVEDHAKVFRRSNEVPSSTPGSGGV